MHMEIERSFLSIVFKDLERFIQRESKYEDLNELTPYALRELAKASALKFRTGPAENGTRTSAISMALRTLSPWKSC